MSQLWCRLREYLVDFNKPISEDEGWKLLEEKTINDRTVIAWYNPDTDIISLMIAHLTDQPNELSRQSPYTTWGYVTHMVSKMTTCKEAAEVVSLYLQDIENDNFWWEKD